MKWIIGLVVVAMLGGGAYGIYRWTDVPEQAQEWMDQKDLENFPTLAQRELNDMKVKRDGYDKARKELLVDIGAREGRKDWDDATKKSERDGFSSIIWYVEEIERQEKRISTVVDAVKKQQDEYVASGVVGADGGIPEDYEYSIAVSETKNVKITLTQAKEETDMAAEAISVMSKKMEYQQSVIDRSKVYHEKMKTLVDTLSKKIVDMQGFINEMKIELKMLKIEQDIAEINEAIAGGSDDNKFGAAINRFRNKQKEFKIEQELVEKEKPNKSIFDKEESSTNSGASASYWE